MINETDEKSLVETKILKEYFLILNEGYVPKASDLKNKVRDRMEMECLDLGYGKQIVLDITDEKIHAILSVYKHVHYYAGQRFYECQNQLFMEWFPHQKLLMITQNA